MPTFIGSLKTLNQLLTAGIAITAFSLLLYTLSFNLRDRVARSAAIIFFGVVLIFVGEALVSVTQDPILLKFLLKLEWVGIIFLPPAYLHFSDAILATTGRPSRGRRRRLVHLAYLLAVILVLTLPSFWLVGDVVMQAPAPYLQATPATWGFAGLYTLGMTFAWFNFKRAYQRAATSTSRRRMRYLIAGAIAPALGTFPFLTFGAAFATDQALIFWLLANISNIFVSVLIVLMAYAVAFFGVSWPDRVVKRRIFKWIMRGPVTASTVLAVTTLVRRIGESRGVSYSMAVPIVMVATLLLMQYSITLLAPVWERALFYGGSRSNLHLVSTLEERLLTRHDLHQFLEAILAAVCDHLQVNTAFMVTLIPEGSEVIISIGDIPQLKDVELSKGVLQTIVQPGNLEENETTTLDIFHWGDFWLIPLFEQSTQNGERKKLLGLLGVERSSDLYPEIDLQKSLATLVRRAASAMEDQVQQQKIFSSLEMLTPQTAWIQQLRAVSQYDGTNVLSTPKDELAQSDLSKWVKDALRHYWGGPKLSQSPLLRLRVVQQAVDANDGISVNALRAILRKGIDQIRPEGQRRFTAEWLLFNILEMKFMEGRKVRDIATRLAMSEADLYRKQRVAIETVAKILIRMEEDAHSEPTTNSSS
ncbi:MAG: hypothetical protein IMY76_05670 [Chloroflexi bacterium]|nr:hypothetical protein [Chloroflexota bacterium]